MVTSDQESVRQHIANQFLGEFEKARSGVYANTAKNRKAGKVGQSYGSKKEESKKNDEKLKSNSKNPFGSKENFDKFVEEGDIIDKIEKTPLEKTFWGGYDKSMKASRKEWISDMYDEYEDDFDEGDFDEDDYHEEAVEAGIEALRKKLGY